MVLVINFGDDTQKMKDQQKDYQDSRNNDPGINPSKAATVSRTDKDFGQLVENNNQMSRWRIW